ncbi:uncharacterized protein N7482_006447 [Penicillium canariense]|uniref:Azaphilone pigments biosynthesis cluster protein L N-terminal domain-containing protein n=1 Tax=Penicillium canariense TaxID=189055 RepID=A0A9W9HV23_9EURO|nr:uncharacterized protein N7482_006447 [Penicillium canariense]KAJ5159443.1 hypothetical protein N7482_006447 [Penicillium canariense]
MESTPTLGCRPANLAVSALSASRALYSRVDSFQSPPTSVRELLQELRALMDALGGLSDTIGAVTDVDLPTLESTLSRCGVACEKFKEEIGKHLPYPDDGSVSPRYWARLRYMGGNIVNFRLLLSGYRSAFEATLVSTHLRHQSFVAPEILEHHKNLIKVAGSDIEVFLECLDDEIGPKIDLDTSEFQQLKEQRLGMDNCLEICTRFFDSIGLIEVKQEENDQASESYDPTAYPGECGKGSFSTFNNYSTGDAVIFTVSTDKRTIHGSNKALGWRSRFLVGHCNDKSLQQVSKDFAFTNTGHLEQKESSTGSNTSRTADNQNSCQPEFLQRYGRGFVVSK